MRHKLLISTIRQWLSAIWEPFQPKSVYQSSLVAKRFIQLFTDHGVTVNQIPRLIPQLSLADLSSEAALLSAITPECLDVASATFGTQAGWLDGSSEQMYSGWSCYKQPQKFFDLLTRVQANPQTYAFRLFTTVDSLNYLNPESQPVVIVVCERLAFDTEKTIYRFHIDTEWNWTELECRLQLKAQALVYYRHLRCPIPIYKISQTDFDALSEWRCVPNTLINSGLLTTPSLEDYILDNAQSVVAKEAEELPLVHDYVSRQHLTLSVTAEIETLDAEVKADNAISEMTSKNAKARYVELDAIKANFIHYHNETKGKNRTASAKTFFNKLDQRSKLTLVPTYDEKDLDTTINKAVRTLTKALRESEK